MTESKIDPRFRKVNTNWNVETINDAYTLTYKSISYLCRWFYSNFLKQGLTNASWKKTSNVKALENRQVFCLFLLTHKI